MPLEPGTRLGPYEIVELRGKGGMGEVYRALDTRLSRDVAVKVLPAELSGDSSFRKRFELEAKTISRLQHPHVCSLFDVGSSEGVEYLVMEYLEGETLEDKIRRGPLRLDDLLRIGSEIADAIAAAHRGGIVHRDLKPGNIIDTRAGIKVLDFGLATGFKGPMSSGATNAPTLAATLTAEGAIVGTLHYMSPEQLEGAEPDAGSDIWALGCVLYEMASGEVAFAGESAASVIAAVMTRRPEPPSRLVESMPPRLDWLIERCLERDRERRWQSARDLGLELDRLRESLGKAGEAAAGPLAGSAGAPARILRVSLELPADTRLVRPDSSLGNPLAISPDGDLVVFAAVREGRSRLYRRDLDAFEATEIPGTEGATSPIFSADGEWIAYHAGGWLQKLRLSDARSTRIRELPHFNGVGLDWRQGEEFVLSSSLLGSGLMRVSEDGRALGELTSLDAELGEYHHAWPRYLPDSVHVVFSVWGGRNTGTWVVSLESGDRRMVLRGALGARLLGDLLFYRSLAGPELLCVPFDMAKLETKGEPQAVADDIYQPVRSGGAGSFAVSRTGSLAYEPAENGRRSLVWLDREGRLIERIGDRGPYESPALSPDGRRVAVGLDSRGGTGKRWFSTSGGDVWIHDLERGTRDRLTHRFDNIRPTWTPDGLRIVFASNRDGPWNLYWKEVDREGEATRLVETAVPVFPWSWSPDGSVLAFQEASAAGYKVGFVSRDGELLPPLGSRSAEKAPTFSPDGRFVAYTSNTSGTDEVFVQPYPPTGQRWMVSNGGGNHARWAGTGEEIFYLRGDELWVAAIETEPEFRADRPRHLFNVAVEPDWVTNYDLSKDGQRLLVVEREPDRALRLVVNWEGQVRRALGDARHPTSS